jgi:CRISPR-associated protein Cas1
MAWRGLHLTRPARLVLADGQLVVRQDDAEVRLALEDIAWMVLDTPQVSLTGALMAACMQAGVVVVTTDARHTPSGMMLPFHTHHRQAHVARIQVAAAGPLKKRLWQRIVRAKIGNQAAALEGCGREPAPLRQMAGLVDSGDPANVEARAAREYWGRLFPRFVREDDGDLRNMLLNYGYAVVRAAVARALVAHGLLPAFGVHHDNAANAFNLADDLVEPFRPFVDRLVWTLTDEGTRRDGEPGVAERQKLAAILLDETKLGRDRVSLLVAAELGAASLVRALDGGGPAVLALPALVPPGAV